MYLHNPFLSELRQPPGGLPRIHRRREDPAVDEVEKVEDAVKVAVLDVEAAVGGAAGGAGVVGDDRVRRWNVL